VGEAEFCFVWSRQRASRLGVAVGRAGRAFLVRLPSPGVYSVARSGLRTLPDGEFDWGGTSVKR